MVNVVHTVLPEAWRPSQFVCTGPGRVMQRFYDPRSFAPGSLIERSLAANRAQHMDDVRTHVMAVLLVCRRLGIPQVAALTILEYVLYSAGSGTDFSGRPLPALGGASAYRAMFESPEVQEEQVAAPEPEGVPLGAAEFGGA